MSNEKIKIQEEWVRRVTWKSLPRTSGLIMGSIALVLFSSLIDGSNDNEIVDAPNLAIAVCFGVWFMVYLLRELLPIGTVGNNLIWTFFGWLIILISTPIFKTFVYFILVGIALWNGSSLLLTLLYFGGLWVFDQFNRPVKPDFLS